MVTLGLPKFATETTIKAENHRLMLDAIRVASGHRVTRTFIVNAHDAALVPPPLNALGRSHAADAASLIVSGKMNQEKIIDFSKQNYQLEPNARFWCADAGTVPIAIRVSAAGLKPGVARLNVVP